MKIIRVITNSLGAKIGLNPGDRLLKINGKKVIDELDYKFRFTEENLILDLEIDGKLSTSPQLVSLSKSLSASNAQASPKSHILSPSESILGVGY